MTTSNPRSASFYIARRPICVRPSTSSAATSVRDITPGDQPPPPPRQARPRLPEYLNCSQRCARLDPPVPPWAAPVEPSQEPADRGHASFSWPCAFRCRSARLRCLPPFRTRPSVRASFGKERVCRRPSTRQSAAPIWFSAITASGWHSLCRCRPCPGALPPVRHDRHRSRPATCRAQIAERSRASSCQLLRPPVLLIRRMTPSSGLRLALCRSPLLPTTAHIIPPTISRAYDAIRISRANTRRRSSAGRCRTNDHNMPASAATRCTTNRSPCSFAIFLVCPPVGSGPSCLPCIEPPVQQTRFNAPLPTHPPCKRTLPQKT